MTGTIPPSAGHRQRLLTEATILHQGVDGLAGLARRSGSHQAGTYLAWIDALTDHGRPEDAADAAREALTLATATAAHLARAADRLAELTTSLGDPIGAVDARRQAWRAQPTRERLLALALAGEAAGNLAQTLAVEANGVRGHDRMACELLLLAGHVETAAAALTRASPLGWSRPTHPGPVVLPYLLVAATAAAPPAAQESQLGQAFAAIDLAFQPPPYLDPSLDFDADLDPDFDPDANIDLDAHAETGGGADDPADHPTPPLTAFLTRSILEHAGTQRQRRQWLAAARTAIEQRVDAIVSNKHRRAYKQAASLTVSYAEALIITGAVGGPEYIAGIRQKYPRHTAFRSELDAATRTSTLASGTR